MTEYVQTSLSRQIHNANELAPALGLPAHAWGPVMWALLDRTDAFFAVKAISSGRYVFANARMQSLAGRDLGGLSDEDWVPAGQVAPLRIADQSATVQTVPQVSEHRIERDGVKREFSVTRLALFAEGASSPTHLCCVWQELTQQRHNEAMLKQALAQIEQLQQAGESLRREVRELAHRDDATGLYQRGQFEDVLRREVDLSSREHREFALVSISLDPLGDIASTMAGDARARILDTIGRLLRGNTRAMDASCRVDDSQFAVLLSGVGLATAHSRMEGLRRQCATQIVMVNGQNVGFTVSMGVASFPHTAHSENELVQAADSALVEAQRRGGNQVTLASIRFASD